MTIQSSAGCCDCATGAFPCWGSSCPNLQPVEQIVCDVCGEETDVYAYDGAELCIDCIFDSLKPSQALFCECCGETDDIRWFHGKQFCKTCVEENLRKVGCYGEF